MPATALAAPGEQGCDPLDPAVCLQPWPNDYFTVADPSTDTGRRLDLNPLAMPRNVSNNPIRPEEWNRNDGFSPGQKIVTKVPGLETPQAFQKTGAVPLTDIERTYDPAQPVVVLNADTRQRHLIWSELDANPADPAGGQLRRGRSLHSGAPQPQERGRQDDQGAAPVPGLPRPSEEQRSGRHSPPSADGAHLLDAAARGHRTQ
jgi:hypothetical protein